MSASIKAAENAGALVQLLPKVSGDTQSLMLGAMMIDGLIHRFQQAGGQSAYVVAGLGDIRDGGGPIVIATARPGQHPEEVEQLFRDLIQGAWPHAREIARSWPTARKSTFSEKATWCLIGTKSTRRPVRGVEIGAAERTSSIRWRSLSAKAPWRRPCSAPGPIFAASCASCGPSCRACSRRCKRRAGRSLATLSKLAINPPPNTKPRLALVTKDAESAEIFAKLWQDLPTATTEFGGNEQVAAAGKGYAQLLVDSLPVKVEGTRRHDRLADRCRRNSRN